MDTIQGNTVEVIKQRKNILRAERDKDNPYYMIRRSSIQNPSLSWQAKGLLAYMLSMPDGWMFHQEELLKHSPNGLWSLKSCFKELKKAGHLKKNSFRNKSGKITHWETIVIENPVDNLDNPEVGFPLRGGYSPGDHVENDTQVIDISQKLVSQRVGKPEGGKSTAIEETLLDNKEDINKKSSSKQGNTNTLARASYSSSQNAAAAFLKNDDEGNGDRISKLANRFHEMLEGTIDINKLIDYIYNYGAQKVEDTVELVIKRGITSKNSPGAFFNSALTNDWAYDERMAPKANKQRLEGREERNMQSSGKMIPKTISYEEVSQKNSNNIEITREGFIAWWKGMSEDGRKVVMREVYNRHCFTEEMFTSRNLNPIFDSFFGNESNRWAVSHLMEILKSMKFI